MNKETARVMASLDRLGITPDDAVTLRRASLTLRRWHERECGDGNGAIERDDAGVPWHVSATTGRRVYRVPDRETGARKRIGEVLARYPALKAYVQTDPRGAALYILRPGDVPEGEAADSYYSRGIAVY